MPVSEEQILQDIQSRIESVWGNTPLSDPKANISDPLVQSQLHHAIGLARLYSRFEAWTAGASPLTATGQDLTLLAALTGQPRKLGIPSIVPVMFCGDQCQQIAAGTVLVDYAGSEWITLSDVKMTAGKGFTDAMSGVGSYDLSVGELKLKDSIDGVTGTNAALPDVGGNEEPDEALRRRLLNIRPHWRVNGTTAALTAELMALDGVITAKIISDLPDCLNECGSQMVAVMGGDDEQIACAILHHIPISPERLIGDQSGDCDCHTINFQRMCPVKVDVRYWANCKCSKETEQDISDGITSKINASLQDGTITGADLARCHTDIERIEVKAVPMALAPDCYEAEELTNPYTGEAIRYATEDPTTSCFVEVDCSEFSTCLDLKPWHFAIAGAVEKMMDCGCPETVGCGCK